MKLNLSSLKLPTIKFPALRTTGLSLPVGKKSGCLGITLEDEGLRFIEARHDSAGVEIKQAGFIQIERGLIENGKIIDEEKVLTQLVLGMKDIKIKNKRAVLAVPTSLVVLRKVLLPPLPQRDIRPMLEVELETSIHLPFSRPYFDFYKLDEKAAAPINSEEIELAEDEQDQYLLIAAPGDLIDQYVELFKELGIPIAAVDIEPLALYRYLDKLHLRTDEDDYMFIHLGLHTVNVSFFKNEIPEFIRNIPLDLTNYQITLDERNLHSNAVLQFLEDRGMFDSLANDLYRELDRVLNFYQFSMKNDGTRVKKIYLTGDFPDLEKILAFLQERISNVEIEIFPLKPITHSFANTKELQGYTVPLGLSMKG